ncbi:MAG: hypothetical protein HY046_04950, partial [Acidobacteria bacterium]|nr:hypothetical protein [Acidobacteriota bacterium]
MGSQAIAAHPPSLTTHVADEFPATLVRSIAALQEWVEQREFAGYEPFDILNSPQLQGRWAYWWPAAILLIQFSKRYAGLGVRSWLRVPESKNAKAMGLFLSAYCDLARCGEDSWDRAAQLKMELKQLRSPGEAEFCWGYDWEHVSRAGRMPAFSPNCVATCFCAQALLDMAEVFGDVEALKMAESAARFIVTRLNRSVDMPEHLCFSYTTRDHMKVYNASAMAGALLARMAPADAEYAPMARRVMNYLASNQRPDGSWYYGASLAHRWIDGFHTAYNLLALLDYQRSMKDDTFDKAIRGGYRYYVNNFFST